MIKDTFFIKKRKIKMGTLGYYIGRSFPYLIELVILCVVVAMIIYIVKEVSRSSSKKKDAGSEIVHKQNGTVDMLEEKSPLNFVEVLPVSEEEEKRTRVPFKIKTPAQFHYSPTLILSVVLGGVFCNILQKLYQIMI